MLYVHNSNFKVNQHGRMEFRDDALSDLNFPMDCKAIRKRNFFNEDADPDSRHLFSRPLKIWICFREIIFSGLECFRSPLLELFTKLIFIYFIYILLVFNSSYLLTVLVKWWLSAVVWKQSRLFALTKESWKRGICSDNIQWVP